MEQGGERLKSYSTAVYFHRVHEIYFPQLAEQWKYLLSIQWRYSETRVKQHPDQHRAGANHFIINGGKKKKTHKKNPTKKNTIENLHILLKKLCFCGDASFQNHILGTLRTDCAAFPVESKPTVWMDDALMMDDAPIPARAHVCAPIRARARTQPDPGAFHHRLPKPEPLCRLTWGGGSGGSSLVSKIKWKC